MTGPTADRIGDPSRLTEREGPCPGCHPDRPDLRCVYPDGHVVHWDGQREIWLSPTVADDMAIRAALLEAADEIAEVCNEDLARLHDERGSDLGKMRAMAMRRAERIVRKRAGRIGGDPR